MFNPIWILVVDNHWITLGSSQRTTEVLRKIEASLSNASQGTIVYSNCKRHLSKRQEPSDTAQVRMKWLTGGSFVAVIHSYWSEESLFIFQLMLQQSLIPLSVPNSR